MRCASCRGTASAAADAPTPGPAPFCSSGICVEPASNQVIRLERRLPTFTFGMKGLSIARRGVRGNPLCRAVAAAGNHSLA